MAGAFRNVICSRAAAVALGVVTLVGVAPPASAVPSQGNGALITNALHALPVPDCTNGQSLIRSEVVSGTPWKAYKIHIPAGGSGWSIIRTLTDVNPAATSFQMLWLKPDGSLLDGSTTAGGTYPGGSVNTLKLRQGNLAVDLAAPSAGMCDGVIGYGYPDPLPAGDYTLLMIAATKGSIVGTFEIYGSPGMRVVRSTEGNDAFVYDVTDFAGDNHTLIVNGKPQKVIIKDGQVSRRVTHQLFALLSKNSFYPDPNTHVTYDGPTGTSLHPDIYNLIQHGAPGNYTFHVDSHGDQSPLVAGADIVLP